MQIILAMEKRKEYQAPVAEIEFILTNVLTESDQFEIDENGDKWTKPLL